MTEDQGAEARFRAAVTRWIVDHHYDGKDPGITAVEIGTDSRWYSTLTGGEEFVELQWRVDGRWRSREIPGFELGGWIGSLLP